jgi:hypothetical protein
VCVCVCVGGGVCGIVMSDTNRKVTGSRPNYVNFSIYLVVLAALGPEVHSVS